MFSRQLVLHNTCPNLLNDPGEKDNLTCMFHFQEAGVCWYSNFSGRMALHQLHLPLVEPAKPGMTSRLSVHQVEPSLGEAVHEPPLLHGRRAL